MGNIKSLNGHLLVDTEARRSIEQVQNNMVSKPKDTQIHKQLVTDGEGNVVWGERLAWKEDKTIHQIPAEYLIGSELSEAHNGKALTINNGKVTLTEVIDASVRENIRQLNEGLSSLTEKHDEDLSRLIDKHDEDLSRLIDKHDEDLESINGDITALNERTPILQGGENPVNLLTEQDIDPTLTQEGKAADAKAVGKNISRLSEEMSESFRTLKETKSDAIMDMSTRAASHKLHAQDAPMHVTLYGKTTETGEGEKSPENPYVISGVDDAKVRAGGANQLPNLDFWRVTDNTNGLTYTRNADGSISIKGTSTDRSTCIVLHQDSRYHLLPGKYTASIAGNDLTEIYVTFETYVGNKWERNLGSLRPGQPSCSFEYPGYSQVLSVYIRVNAGVTIDRTIYLMLNAGDTPLPYEKYVESNVTDLPLLPDNAPLMGDGTVDDIIENDVPSGCDKKIVLDGVNAVVNDPYTLTSNGYKRFQVAVPFTVDSSDVYSESISCQRTAYDAKSWRGWDIEGYSGNKAIFLVSPDTYTVDTINAYFAANPLTIYYRSTDYTPDKDLRVCRVTRQWESVDLDGTEKWEVSSHYFYLTGNKLAGSTRPGLCSKFAYAYNYHGNCIFGNYAGDIYAGEVLTESYGYDVNAWKEALAANGGTKLIYKLLTPETYYTDPIELRKPNGLMPVIVTGSGETAVEYVHDTKHCLEEKADKKDIPSPYVLPTASAEVKGGVKVGNGLQMDGEVLGVVPEGKWERIEKFTVEEENLTSIRRTAFPDGTVYNLAAAKVIVKMHCPVSAAYGTRVDFRNNNSNIAQMVITMVTNSSTNTNYVQTGLFQILPVSGIYQVTGAKGSQGGEMPFLLPPNANFQTSSVEKKIDRIDYVLWDGRTIPVGTEIEIWGVRADA